MCSLVDATDDIETCTRNIHRASSACELVLDGELEQPLRLNYQSFWHPNGAQGGNVADAPVCILQCYLATIDT